MAIGIFHNTSGLITRGLGELNKLLTRGLGPSKKIIKGLLKPIKNKIFKEYVLDVLGPIQKEGLLEVNIIVPVWIHVEKNIFIKSNVQKEIVKSFDVRTKIDSTKLFEIIDEI